METIEYTYIDRSRWPEQSGPWENEPDKVQYQDEETGLPCLIVRGLHGALCGYVGVAGDHPAHGADYDSDVLRDVDVHWGLTFSDRCHESPDNHGICHIPAEGEPDNVWWLGFDCAHCNDLTPGYERTPLGQAVYRDMDFVKREIKSLAAQLSRMVATS